MLRKIVVKYLLRLSDADYARFVGSVSLFRKVRRDGLEESRNAMSIHTIAFRVEFVAKKKS